MSQITSNLPAIHELVARLQNHMRLYGYDILDLPLIGPADLFLVKAGDELINRLVTFERHGQELALRPEFTVLAADQVIRERLSTNITRWQFGGPIFQDMFNTGAQDYQKLSLGAELIGMSGAVADAEIIGMALLGLTSLGLDNIHIIIGHAGLTRNIVRYYQLDSLTEKLLFQQQDVLQSRPDEKKIVLEMLTQHLQSHTRQWSAGDSLSEDIFQSSGQPPTSTGLRTTEEIARRMIRKQRRATEVDKLAAAIEFLGEWSSISGTPREVFEHLRGLVPDDTGKVILENWYRAVKLLEKHGVAESHVTIQPGLARSWEYYSGIVFEIKSLDQHLGGGGRYDGLAQLLGSAEDIPAVGFAYYMDNVLSVLSDHITTAQVSQAVFLDFPSELAVAAVSFATQLRNRGIPCALLNKPEGTSSSQILSLKDTSTVDFRGKGYSFDQIDLLIDDLGQES